MKKQNLTTNETRLPSGQCNKAARSQEDHVFLFGETEVRTRTDFLEIMFWVSGERSYSTAILPLLNLAAFLICVLHDLCFVVLCSKTN
jgi:hypothetical protein